MSRWWQRVISQQRIIAASVTGLLISMAAGCKSLAKESPAADELAQLENLEIDSHYQDACASEFFGSNLKQCLATAERYDLAGDIVAACISTFSLDRGRLLCLKIAGKHQLHIGHIDVCEEVFNKEKAEYECLLDVAAMNIGAEEMDACHSSFDTVDDIQVCFSTSADLGLVSSQIDACSQTFGSPADNFNCMNVAAENQLQDFQIMECRGLASSADPDDGLRCLYNLSSVPPGSP